MTEPEMILCRLKLKNPVSANFETKNTSTSTVSLSTDSVIVDHAVYLSLKINQTNVTHVRQLFKLILLFSTVINSHFLLCELPLNCPKAK
jgi:hypothetical protein